MRVEWTLDAEADLENILSYIADRDAVAAASVAQRIDRAVDTIAHFPRAARLDEETGAREYVVRGLPLLIIYVAADDWVEIIGIFHTARDPEGKPRP
jgi:plasmid stabilization system protein ParE